MRAVRKRDGSNNPLVSYTRGNDLSAGGIGYSGGNFTTHNFYFADGNGNVTYMLNSSQSMVASYRYDPFGNTISSSGALANTNLYRFSSKEIHANSGMYYYGYRFYDPNLQRWINKDPLGERGGINLYGCFGNDPVTRIDPFGRNYQGFGDTCLKNCDDQLMTCISNPKNYIKPTATFLAGCLLKGALTALRFAQGLSLSLGFTAVDCYSTYFGCVSGCPPMLPYPKAPPGSGCSTCPVNSPPILDL